MTNRRPLIWDSRKPLNENTSACCVISLMTYWRELWTCSMLLDNYTPLWLCDDVSYLHPFINTVSEFGISFHYCYTFSQLTQYTSKYSHLYEAIICHLLISGISVHLANFIEPYTQIKLTIVLSPPWHFSNKPFFTCYLWSHILRIVFQ